jgi:hypothetical protein
MKKVTKMVYVYNAICFQCNLNVKVYYTVSDFGDAPIIRKCSHCGELYWYTPDDEAYIRLIFKQLIGKHCEKCNTELLDNLIPTHKNIQCCSTEFSLEDDFAGYNIPPATEMVPIDVYLIYS